VTAKSPSSIAEEPKRKYPLKEIILCIESPIFFKKKIKSRTFSEVSESTNLQRKVKLSTQPEKEKI
jgi:hypothetical protein